MSMLLTLARVGRTARKPTQAVRLALLRLPALGRVVRAGPSAIAGEGLFVLRPVRAGETIGALELGPAGPQGRHTLLVGTEHRLVAKPWRFLNHACAPTAALEFTPDSAVLSAARDLPAFSELTIDYNALPEDVGTAFECRCARCRAAAAPSRIGGEPS